MALIKMEILIHLKIKKIRKIHLYRGWVEALVINIEKIKLSILKCRKIIILHMKKKKKDLA